MLKGYIAKILNQYENDWGRYQIDSFGKTVLAVGIIPNACLRMEVCLNGKEVDTNYGHQFNIESVEYARPDELCGLIRYLSEYVKGMSESRIAALIQKYGKDALKIFDMPQEECFDMLTSIKGIKKATATKIMDSLQQTKKYKDIVLFLSGGGTRGQVEKIYEKYGDKSVTILRKNPYRLQMDLNGFGFKKTDAIARNIGIKPDAPERIIAGIKYIIDDAATSRGHCYLPVAEIRESIGELLVPTPKSEDIDEKNMKIILERWPENKEDVISRKDPSAETIEKLNQTAQTRDIIEQSFAEVLSRAITDGDLINLDGNIYTKEMYAVETECARLVRKSMASKSVRFISKEKVEACIKAIEYKKTQELRAAGKEEVFELTPEQRSAIYKAAMNRMCILSGGPGRGKTTICQGVADAFLSASKDDVISKDDVVMLAPTGRAAQRISESTGYPAETIHRAVLRAEISKEYPKGKLVIVDEFSMVDIYLFLKLLKYAENCNIVFVGDVNQISSVGPGKVLKDLIDSEVVPCVLLTTGHRNTGSIAHNAELINNGVSPSKYCYDEHFVFVASNKDHIAEKIIADYVEKVKQYGIQNVMLCTAMRERGNICVNKLNSELQKIFGDKNEVAKFGNQTFCKGDRVMQTRNDYYFVTRTADGHEQLGVFNGDRGTVVKVIYDDEEESYKMVVLFDDGRIGGYTKNSVSNLSLAYAMTLHKCQGSEAACMMMGYVFGDYLLLNRSLFYTGETRAKKEFRFYGEIKTNEQGRGMYSAFDLAVKKKDDKVRYTSLTRFLQEEER